MFVNLQIANAVNEGRLVPEDVIFGLLSKRLEEGYYRGETGFILDGIPRTRIQAVSIGSSSLLKWLCWYILLCGELDGCLIDLQEILDQIADVDLVVNLKCEGECFLKNNMGSGVCSHCGQAFGAKTRSELCISHRQLKSTPSNVHALKEKFRVYAEQVSIRPFLLGLLKHTTFFFCYLSFSDPIFFHSRAEQALGRLLQKEREASEFSGGRWAWRDLAETLGCFASPTHSRFVFLFPEIDCIVDWRPKTMPVSTLSFACPFLRLWDPHFSRQCFWILMEGLSLNMSGPSFCYVSVMAWLFWWDT